MVKVTVPKLINNIMGELTLNSYLLIGLVIWTSFLSFFLFKAVKHYQNLGRGENIKNLSQVLEGIISKQNIHSNNIDKLARQVAKQVEIDRQHFSKQTILRFNPFEESGGDQSFVIVLLNDINNGIVISSLHSRSGTRVYAKEVLAGKAVSHKFSKEEKEAVEKTVQRAGEIKSTQKIN